MTSSPKISISIVSHLQIAMVKALLDDLDRYCETCAFEVILTLNLPEKLPFELTSFSFPVKLIRNDSAKGFGANHNQAFKYANGRYFCVMNPDIRLDSNPFEALLACLADSTIGVVAPLVLGEDGEVEDSARRFPTPLTILCKALGRCKGTDYLVGLEPFHPDWVGGMCMLFPNAVFARLGGFDERYFLYYEDVDLCARLRLLGYEVLVNPQAKVTHHAQRTSRRSMTYLRWHFKSMMRFFLSPSCWRVHRVRRV
jgi:N-acetylglucosaminyl-diphospho-decaprenol L-rhamnosyltransferase